MTEPVRSLRYAGGVLLLIDQRRLPAEVVELRCESAGEVAAAIRGMAVRGAPAIGVAAAYGVVIAARRAARATAGGRGSAAAAARQAALDAIAELAPARPTAVNLSAALDRMRGVLEATERDERAAPIEERLEQAAVALERFEIAASEAMGRFAADLLPADARVLLHCNAGALATVERGTALAAVHEAWGRGRLRMAYVGETRPRLQGMRLTAFELERAGIPHTIVVDSLAATLLRRREIDAVLVGADRVAANGDVANKVGTYALAVLCAHHGVPLLVVAPTTTIDLGCPDGESIPIEERDADEVSMIAGERLSPAGSAVLNPAFDVTPAALVTVLVTERGALSPVNASGIVRLGAREDGAGGPPHPRPRHRESPADHEAPAPPGTSGPASAPPGTRPRRDAGK